LIVLLAAVLVTAFALPAMADVSFFGSGRIVPTYYKDFDFDSSAADAAILNEGGLTSGEHIRSEIRLGWKAGGDKWKIMMIAESDLIYNKNNADRSYYSTALAPNSNIPNAGAEFGIERAELSYAFAPALELFTGWPISAVDIGTGGLLYGDDHPVLGFRGKVTDNLKYQLVYISIQNTPPAGAAQSTLSGDWRAYFLKPEFSFGTAAMKGTVSPILLFSDNRQRNAKVTYYGVEGIGQFGMIKPSFEVIVADGEFRSPSTVDIKSYAAFAGVEVAVNKAFNPYVAFRYTKGDDNTADTEAEGFVGVTDIGRFTPLMGMDGNILGEHLTSGGFYNSPLYSFAPERAVGGNLYGGIGNGASGNNPGSKIIALGAKGSLDDFVKNFSYKAQIFGIWFDKTNNLSVGSGKTVTKVDTYAGTTFDLSLKYDFSKAFYANYIFSVFLPGDGIKDQQATTADDTYASLHTMNLVWTY
jgi:hypothetical protein